MPRLTTKDYLRTHDRLRQLWLHDEGIFAELRPKDQWLLHEFFIPDQELRDPELLIYRDRVTKQRPSLPHQAGRALSRFWGTTARVGVERVTRTKALASAKRLRQSDRHLIVKPLVRSELDVHQLARAFIALGRERARKQAMKDDQERFRP